MQRNLRFWSALGFVSGAGMLVLGLTTSQWPTLAASVSLIAYGAWWLTEDINDV
ncbi:MAG: hypothetical protein ACON4N_04655 [Myxococcota bacterium]